VDERGERLAAERSARVLDDLRRVAVDVEDRSADEGSGGG
jgi:hypothetical protein